MRTRLGIGYSEYIIGLVEDAISRKECETTMPKRDDPKTCSHGKAPIELGTIGGMEPGEKITNPDAIEIARLAQGTPIIGYHDKDGYLVIPIEYDDEYGQD